MATAPFTKTSSGFVLNDTFKLLANCQSIREAWCQKRLHFISCFNMHRLDVSFTIKRHFERIELLPKTSKERKEAEKVVNKVTALIKGHLTRIKFKKIKFLNRVTGRKAHQIPLKDINMIPSSTMRVVLQKEGEFGNLKIDGYQIREIE